MTVNHALHSYIGSNPILSTTADVAQLVERILGKNEVSGPIPDVGSNKKTPLSGVFYSDKIFNFKLQAQSLDKFSQIARHTFVFECKLDLSLHVF